MLLENLEEVAKGSLVEPRPDVPHRLELSVAIDTQEEGTERLGAATLPRGPSADDALHRSERLDLHPRGRARARLIDRVEPLRDDPFDTLLACSFEECDPCPGESFASSDRAHPRQRLVQPSPPLAPRLARERL